MAKQKPKVISIDQITDPDLLLKMLCELEKSKAQADVIIRAIQQRLADLAKR
jgi:hypothetical protein